MADLEMEDVAVFRNEELGGSYSLYPNVSSPEEVVEHGKNVSDSFSDRNEYVGTLDEMVDDLLDEMELQGRHPRGVFTLSDGLDYE